MRHTRSFSSIFGLLAVVLALLLAPLTATAQTICDGPAPTDPFVLAPGETGATFAFSHVPADYAIGAGYRLLFRTAPTGAVLSQQNVTRAAVRVLGPMATDATQSCYELPVIPVSQIPRGQLLYVTLVALSSDASLVSLESNQIPFGAPLQAPALRVR